MEQEPDQRVRWESTSGARNNGEVSFERLDAGSTRVNLVMDWEPRGVVQKTGEALGFDERQVEGRPEAIQGVHRVARTGRQGAWRGTIEQGTTAS
jgi:uncharacterized membrane protein